MLRKAVAGFEAEKNKVVKEACVTLEKQLSEKFATEQKLRVQEANAEKEILSLKIETLTAESTKQAKEIDFLKRALSEATQQVKDIAVKVIESSNISIKASSQTE